MTRARSYSRSSQRAEFVKGSRPEEPDVTLDGITLGRETEKAVLVTMKDGQDMWMPLSQVRRMTKTKREGEDSMVISAWIAKEKGLA